MSFSIISISEPLLLVRTGTPIAIASIATSPNVSNFDVCINNFDLLNNKTLLVLDKPNKNILLSSRNLSKAKVVLASELNTYDIMNANKMLFVESSIKVVEETF